MADSLANSRQAGVLSSKNHDDREHECQRVVLEFGDLSCEANRIRLIEAMVLDRVIPGGDPDSHRLEAAFMMLPRGSMNEVIATAGKLNEAFRERAAFVLKGFQDLYVAQGNLQARDPVFER